MTYPTGRPAIWFVTGASRGLGLQLVRQLLERGENVAATTRSIERLTSELRDADRTSLLPLAIDLAEQSQVAAAIAQTAERFGGIDVVVNNAGYGFLGAVEEITDEEVRAMFDVQVFGVWNVLRAVLPVLRAAGSGHVINVSSILGLTSFPGWGLYCAGKFALEGLTESLQGEVAGLGIDVTLVEPGYLRTDFLRPASLGLPARESDAYPAVREMTETHKRMPGSQLGDPTKAAAAIIAVAVRGGAPVHQILGSDSLQLAEARVQSLQSDIEAGRALATTTDVMG